MTARIFTLTLPLAKLHNSNHRGHWSVKAGKRALMRGTASLACGTLAPIHGQASLTVTFAFPDNRNRDLDNIEIKGAIDGAVDAGIITDDRAKVLVSVTRMAGSGRSPKGYAVLTFAFTPVHDGTTGESE